MSHYETATAGRKPTTSGIRVTNAKAHAKLRKHELGIRIEALQRNIKFHEHDVNPDRDLAHLIVSWRKELMEAKLERSTLGLG